MIIPCFNQGRFVQTCIDSLVQQSHASWRAVLIDDASTDGVSPGMVARAGRTDGRVRVVLGQRNRGRAGARLHACELLGGVEAILVLDADDLLTPAYMEQLAHTLTSRADAAMAYGQLEWFGAESAQASPPRRWPLSDFNASRLFLEEQVPGPGALIRTEDLERIRPWRSAFNRTSAEDEDLATQLAELGRSLVFVPAATYLYRQHASSFLATSGSVLRAEAKLNILRHHRRELRRRGSVEAFLERWILPELRACMRARRLADVGRLAGWLRTAALGEGIRLMASYYWKRLWSRRWAS